MINAAILVDDFFAPASSDAIDTLLGEYERTRRQIETVGQFMHGPEMARAAGFFFTAQRQQFDRFIPSVDTIFDPDAACKALDAHFWERALNMTDVMDFMPNKHRQEWFEQIRNMDCPAFEENTVRDNIERLLAGRIDFLAEKVDGIFMGLSGTHVTNRPQGFSKRMIIDYVFSDFGTTTSKAGLFQDFRSVIAKLMSRDQPQHAESRRMLDIVRKNTGVWHQVDGNAFRIRVYKKGTAHLEVHPDIAVQLNQILAHRHPHAIPSEFCRPAPRRRKTTQAQVFDRPLPFAVLHQIELARLDHSGRTLSLSPAGHIDKHVRQEVMQIMEAIGGVWSDRQCAFDYDASTVIDDILLSGMIPDARSHQFYPTPETLAAEAVALADIEPGHTCLEPSAGQGGLACHMPNDTLCVETSDLYAQILAQKGYPVRTGDFLSRHWGSFDRIVMNPPFSQGRAEAHVAHAVDHLTPGGRLVAIVPEGLLGKDLAPGYKTTFTGPTEVDFPGTSIRVGLVTVERP